MGLMDVLNGMQNGPRGPSTPERSGGMSKITMAILALLAYKAVKKLGSQPQAAPAGKAAPQQIPTQTTTAQAGSGGGGLGGFLGGLLAGGAAGSVLSGGLGDLLSQFQQAGHGDKASSWVSNGPNKAISPGDLANALGADQISMLMHQTGLSQQELLEGLSQFLPDTINHLTPDGRVPNEHEASRMI